MSPQNLIFEIYTNALKSLLISVPKKKSADKLGLNVRKNNLTFNAKSLPDHGRIRKPSLTR